MSVNQNFPEVSPSLLLDFANSRTLDPRITFTRSSIGTYVASNGLIKTAAADEPRFDHDPETGESLGLLIEESRTNYVGYLGIDSNIGRFGNSPASYSYTTAPDGTTTAIIPIPDSNADRFETYINLSDAIAGEIWNFSWFEKNIAYPNAEPVAYPNGHINLTSVTSPQLIATYPNGWKRWSVRATVVTTGSEVRFRYYFGERIGIGNDNIAAFWGHQAEKGSFATSYIRGNGVIATRQPDNASITGTNFSDWYNPDEVSVIGEYSSAQYQGNLTPASYPSPFAIDNTSTTRLVMLYQRYDNRLDAFVRSGAGNSVEDLNIYSPATSLDYSNIKFGVATSNSGLSGIVNDGSIVTDTSVNMPQDVNRVVIGGGYGANPFSICGSIKYLRFYSKKLSNSQLQNLTK